MSFVKSIGFSVLALAVFMKGSWAEANDSRERLASLLATVPACDLLELSSDGALAQLGDKDQILKAEWLDIVSEVTAEGIPRPRAKTERAQYHREIDSQNERYFTTWPKNNVFRKQIISLASQLREDPSLNIKINDVTSEADRRIREARAKGQIGECYKISQVTGTFNTEWIQMVALPAKAQAQIDELFNPDGHSVQFTEKEIQLIQSGTVTLNEMIELRAIRMATRIFEQNTVLIYDKAGFQGNMDFGGKVRSVCRTEAQTYYFFLRRLQARGLLKHFRPSETWAYRKRKVALDGHGASLLESRRTGDLIVVDSWHEHGGIAAHLTFFSDWKQERDRADIVSAE